MISVPQPRIELGIQHWKCSVLTSGLPGNSLKSLSIVIIHTKFVLKQKKRYPSVLNLLVHSKVSGEWNTGWNVFQIQESEKSLLIINYSPFSIAMMEEVVPCDTFKLVNSPTSSDPELLICQSPLPTYMWHVVWIENKFFCYINPLRILLLLLFLQYDVPAYLLRILVSGTGCYNCKTYKYVSMV